MTQQWCTAVLIGNACYHECEEGEGEEEDVDE